jgi:hypothetical protein
MNKILFRILRFPIPWIIRYYTSKFLSIIIFPKKKHNLKIDNEFYENFSFLKKNGYLIIENFLNEFQIDSIVKELSNFKVSDPWDTSKGFFNPHMPPSGTHVGYYKKSDLSQISILKEISNSPQLNAYISKYVGKNFKCTGMGSWWTFGNNINPQEAELFHRDIDNLLWLKVFIYLTDVDENCGPHVFIPGSHRMNKSLTFRRIPDAEANMKFGKFTYHLGKKGTLIIEDTFGLHKGQHISSNKNRLIFQLQYSILDNPLKTA